MKPLPSDLSEALAASVKRLERSPLTGLRAASSSAIVEELWARDAGRTGALERPTRAALLDEITARIIVDERKKLDPSTLCQRVAKRWHHVMQKHWLPAPLPSGEYADEVLRRFKDAHT